MHAVSGGSIASVAARTIRGSGGRLELLERHPPLRRNVTGGVVGVIFDGRGRPLQLPEEADTRHRQLLEWLIAAGALDDAPAVGEAAVPAGQ